MGEGTRRTQPARAAAGRGPARRPAGRGQDDDGGQARTLAARRASASACCSSAPTCIGRPRSCSSSGWASSSTIDVAPARADQTPIAIANAALDAARRGVYDVLIVDTAGRLHVDEEMMAEVRELARRAATDRDAVRGRQHGGPGRGQRSARLRRGVAPHRRRADQGRRRCARRRSAVGAHRDRVSRSCSSASARSRTRSSPSSPSAWRRGFSAWATCCRSSRR